MRDEQGTATLMIVGLALVLAMMAAVVTDASAAYLQRQGLDTLADGAALAAADAGASGLEAYGEGLSADLHLDADLARTAVADYLRRVGAFTRLVEADARRRLAEEKGPEHVADVVVRPTIDRLDFTSARRSDLEEMRREIYPLARRLAVLRGHCADLGRDPDDVEVTVLDVPVLGTDREDVARRVERLRGRVPATAYARSHHAGSAPEHATRYAELAEAGVGTVFVALPDLVDADDLGRLEPVLSRLR